MPEFLLHIGIPEAYIPAISLFEIAGI